MAITIRHKGNFNKVEKFLHTMLRDSTWLKLERYGEIGLEALRSVTPVQTGLTASSWFYEIKKDSNGYSIAWYNDNENNGFNILIGLQYGHGTGTGGYVVGRDFINPAIRPIFDEIADGIWTIVQSS